MAAGFAFGPVGWGLALGISAAWAGYQVYKWRKAKKGMAHYKSSKPVGKANRKKQGREVNQKKRISPKGKKKWKNRSNKNSNRKMKRHTPSKRHKGGK
ncbi:hypothetical protein [Listeria sp. PSOL-1]|uniref:hypothetical protein n=1 Tax=Listeria sp. PSOL-1 TaxID=1844999 RepID=UPI001E624BB8|nr:hypothetical protein [Listeria sp. PSOL-1]